MRKPDFENPEFRKPRDIELFNSSLPTTLKEAQQFGRSFAQSLFLGNMIGNEIMNQNSILLLYHIRHRDLMFTNPEYYRKYEKFYPEYSLRIDVEDNIIEDLLEMFHEVEGEPYNKPPMYAYPMKQTTGSESQELPCSESEMKRNLVSISDFCSEISYEEPMPVTKLWLDVPYTEDLVILLENEAEEPEAVRDAAEL